MDASLKCLSWSAAERYASAARTVLHMIVGPARDERCVVLSLSCGARPRRGIHSATAHCGLLHGRRGAAVGLDSRIGFKLSLVAVTIAATNGVVPEGSGLAPCLLNATSQVGGALGLAILSTISTSRATSVLRRGAALTLLLPRKKRATENGQAG
jgi:hypothetical protein